MSSLAATWTRWSEKFAARSRRERMILALLVVGGGSMLGFNFGIEPHITQIRTSIRAESAARAELAKLEAQLVVLKQGSDPDLPTRQRIERAKKELEAVSGRLAHFESGMVPPERMQAFLEGLLARNRAIELLGLKTLPVTMVGAPATPSVAEGGGEKAAPGAATPVAADGIYQHGVEIRLAGSYHDLLNYLAELERMPQRVMWNSATLSVETYPRNVLVLRVYTLSLDKNWLIV